MADPALIPCLKSELICGKMAGASISEKQERQIVDNSSANRTQSFEIIVLDFHGRVLHNTYRGVTLTRAPPLAAWAAPTEGAL
jgi:hypothetical protein